LPLALLPAALGCGDPATDVDDSSSWAFACNIDGPCCMSDGATTCDKALVSDAIVLPVGATAYVFVNATAAYEVAITSG
jgi:hypothetical protein